MFTPRIDRVLGQSVEFVLHKTAWQSFSGPLPAYTDIWVRQPILTPSYDASYEVLVDSVDGSRRTWNPVSHYVRRCEVLLSVPCLFRSGSAIYDDHFGNSGFWRWQGHNPAVALYRGVTFGTLDNPSLDLFQLYQVVEDDFVVTPPPNLDSLLEGAMKHLLPGLKDELSLVNSIIELKDFKSVSHTAAKLSLALDNKLAYIKLLLGKAPLKAKKKTFADLSRIAADLNLQNSFNLMPLLSDINGLLTAFRTYQAQLMRLLKQSEQMKKRHHTMMLPFPDDEREEISPVYTASVSDAGDVQNQVRRNTVWKSAKFHVELQYTYQYTEAQRQHAVLFALLDKLGVNFNPAIIWNAIRWTFVIDWVFGVSHFLEQFKRANLEPEIVIHKALWSIKYERQLSMSLDSQDQIAIPVSSVTETAYRRTPFTMTPHLITSSGLSPKEFVLGGSLLITRRPRHYRR